MLPDLPTLAEAGATGYEFGAWYGILAPAHLPAGIASQLQVESQRALQTPDVKARIDAEDLDLGGGDFSGAELGEGAAAAAVDRAFGQMEQEIEHAGATGRARDQAGEGFANAAQAGQGCENWEERVGVHGLTL